MEIIEITEYSVALEQAVDRFLKQLVKDERSVTTTLLKTVIKSNNSYLLCALDDSGQYIGMTTVGIYASPTGLKGWIEDVVVDGAKRGQGVGMKLIEHAMHLARDKNVHLLTLTSRPARVAANALYRKLGFKQKETNVYQIGL